MDSLLASYASSDEDDDEPQHQPQATTVTHPPPLSLASKASFLFSSLPKPQSYSSLSSSSVFSSLPPPKSSSNPPSSFHVEEEEDPKPPSKASALFSSLPVPKSQTTPDFSLPVPNPKRVIQFRPPVPQTLSTFDSKDEDEHEEDAEERERKKKRQVGQGTSVKSFLSSMPTPKNSLGSALGSLPVSSGSSRRSIIETEGTAPSSSGAIDVKSEVGLESDIGNGQENSAGGSNSHNYEVGVAGDQSYAGHEGYDVYGSSGGYDSYGGYGQYDAGWYGASSTSTVTETSVPIESFANMGGKRRKDQAPTEIVEVKQDELMKDRPREDKSRLTGIAFGPSYQPTSTKGKPTKLHKRKHQIGSLFFDMKQKEMELAERRSKGLLTKAETQAKYGW